MFCQVFIKIDFLDKNCNISPKCNTFLLDRKMYVSKKVFQVISEVEIYVSNECQKLVLSDNAFKDGFRLKTKKSHKN